MIQIRREGTKVECRITVRIPNYDARVFMFHWECGNESYAGLLTEAVRDQLYQVVEDARREAYEQGYKDAKSKKAKQTWFRGAL